MRPLYLLLMLLAVGCGDDGDAGSNRLRSDIVEIFPPEDTLRVISDVDVEGDRIALLFVRYIQYVSFTISEDRGATWTTYELDIALGTDFPWDANQVGVHLQGGKIFFLLTRDFSPLTTEWGLYEVTLHAATPERAAEMTLTEITPSSLLHPMGFVQKRPNGNLRGLATLGGTVPVAYELNAVTGEMTYDEPVCSGRACNVLFWFSGNGGDSFHGYSKADPGIDVCRMRWSETEPPRQACVRPYEWFVPNYSHNHHVMVSDDEQPYVAWSQDDQAYAVGITDAGALTPVLPLGPGRIENFSIGRLGTPRFAEFEHIAPGEGLIDEGRLARITSSGPEQVNFRETPCAGVGCGYFGGPNFGLSLVNWIEPTGRGDYYVFYVVQWNGTGGNQQGLYLSRSETPTFTPIEASGPLPGPPTHTPPVDAALMTQVQQACVAIWTCFNSGQADQGIAACVRQLTTSSPHQPYIAAYRARLFAALPGGCAAIDAAQGNGAGTCSRQCTLSGGTCPAGSSVCSTSVALSMCNTCSDATTFIDCSGGSAAFAVSCPGGTTCSANVGCVQTAPCDVNASTRCEGTDRITCDASSSVAITEDCAGRGGTCALTACESTQVGASCSELTYGTRCDGPYILSCGQGKVVYADCRSLGHATCVAQAGGGYGRCTE